MKFGQSRPGEKRPMGSWGQWWIGLCVGASFLSLASCGGGGGAGSSSTPPYEFVYALSQTTSNNSGLINYYAINPGSGALYPSSEGSISTGGYSPVAMVADPTGPFLYVLNGSTSNSITQGSLAGFRDASFTSQMASVGSSVQAGSSPLSMAIDPKGGYLVVASQSGFTVFSVSQGSVSPMGVTFDPSPCSPFRVVFGAGAQGSLSDVVYLACSSPQALYQTNSTMSNAIYECSLQMIETNGCTDKIFNPTNSSYAMTGFALDPTQTHLVAPMVENSNGAYSTYIVCEPAPSQTAPNLTCPSTLSISSNSYFLGGNMAFSGSGATESVFFGDYDPNSNGNAFSSPSEPFFSCSLSSSSGVSNCLSQNSVPHSYAAYGFLASSTTLYMVATGSPVNGAYYLGSTSGVVSGQNPHGEIVSCPLPITTSTTCNGVSTANSPVGITSDPNGDFIFVPTLSGTVDVYSANSLSNISSSSLNFSGQEILSVLVPGQ